MDVRQGLVFHTETQRQVRPAMGRSEPGRLRLYLLECRLDAGLQGEGPARARDSLLGQLRLRRLCLSALRRGRLQQPGRGFAEGDILKSLQSPAACGQTGSCSIPRLMGLRLIDQRLAIPYP